MNERIRELALQSKLRPALLLHHWGKIDALTDSEKEELEQLEKFAELIVRECVQSIEKTIETICDTDSEKMGCEFAITDMLGHFGVKE